VPVFVDSRPDTLNIDLDAAAAAVSDRTKAVFVVHYGGVAAQIDGFVALAERRGLALVEDNAHGFGGYWRGRHLGTFGSFGAQSWHDTKNVCCGEGGALLVNRPGDMERAEEIREKGTNRARFFRGDVDKYSWVEGGSSYLPSDLLAALLLAQLERFDDIQRRRMRVWSTYSRSLTEWADDFGVEQMTVPDGCEHPAHLYYLVMPRAEDQAGLIEHLRRRGIVATFHYQPLDSSTAGRRLGRTPFPCRVAADRSQRLVRLPLHPVLTDSELEQIVEAVTSYRPQP
jgi:dTDP-4-amino-4,6-dideoxygalactose transaminase